MDAKSPANSVLDPRDGGMASRKLWFAIGTSCGVFAGAVVCSVWPAMGANYQVMVGGMLGALAAYSGSNVAAKYVIAKSIPGSKEPIETNQADIAIGGEAC